MAVRNPAGWTFCLRNTQVAEMHDTETDVYCLLCLHTCICVQSRLSQKLTDACFLSTQAPQRKSLPVWLAVVMEVTIRLIKSEDEWKWEALQCYFSETFFCIAYGYSIWQRIYLTAPMVSILQSSICHRWKMSFPKQLWHLTLTSFCLFLWFSLKRKVVHEKHGLEYLAHQGWEQRAYLKSNHLSARKLCTGYRKLTHKQFLFFFFFYLWKSQRVFNNMTFNTWNVQYVLKWTETM